MMKKCMMMLVAVVASGAWAETMDAGGLTGAGVKVLGEVELLDPIK